MGRWNNKRLQRLSWGLPLYSKREHEDSQKNKQGSTTNDKLHTNAKEKHKQWQKQQRENSST
jgi:hypothetical protein